jgi:hypothetical protein
VCGEGDGDGDGDGGRPRAALRSFRPCGRKEGGHVPRARAGPRVPRERERSQGEVNVGNRCGTARGEHVPPPPARAACVRFAPRVGLRAARGRPHAAATSSRDPPRVQKGASWCDHPRATLSFPPPLLGRTRVGAATLLFPPPSRGRPGRGRALREPRIDEGCLSSVRAEERVGRVGGAWRSFGKALLSSPPFCWLSFRA